MASVATYLNFMGQTEEAFTRYAEIFGTGPLAGVQRRPASRLRPSSGSRLPMPYSLKRWYSVGARNAVPADTVARHCGVIA